MSFSGTFTRMTRYTIAAFAVVLASFSLPSAALAGSTDKSCSSPMSGVIHLRAANGVSCQSARRVVTSREQLGRPPFGWNCYLPKKVAGTRYTSRACKQGMAHGGATVRYWVLHPAAFSGSTARRPVGATGARQGCGAANFYGYPVYDISGGNLSCRSVRRLGVRWAHVSLSRLTRTGRGCDRVGSICSAGINGRTYRCVARRTSALPRVHCLSGSHQAAWTFSGDL